MAQLPRRPCVAGNSCIGPLLEDDLDFILCFDEQPAWEAIGSAARLGLWKFRLRGATETRGTPLLDAALETCFDQGRPGRAVLRSGCLAVIRHSWAATRRQLDREMARWPALVCAGVLRGWINPLQQPCSTPGQTGDAEFRPIRRRCRALAPWHAAKYVFERLFVQQTWAIGIIDLPIETLLENQTSPVCWLAGSSARYRYLADPFLFASSHDPNQFSFMCEEFDSVTLNRGRIVVAHVREGVIRQTVPLPQLDAGVHAAYPFVFRHEGHTYCVPETAEAGGIDLYRCDAATGAWTKVCRLVDDWRGIDSTVFRHEGRWWLATCSADDGPYHNLFLFHADALQGPWHPHVANPVKCDVRSARPAGTPFERHGRLYRPAQDCSVRYGGSVSINRIEVLTPLEFRETVVARVAPDPSGPFPLGLHTLCAGGARTLVDGRRDFFDPLKQVRKQIIRRFSYRTDPARELVLAPADRRPAPTSLQPR